MRTTIRPLIVATAGCAIAALAAAGAVAASPWVVTSWRSIDLSQDACLTHAEQAIRNGGFRASQSLKQSRFGGTGEYTVAIRCIADKGIVFFLASGPDGGTADKYVTKLEGGF